MGQRDRAESLHSADGAIEGAANSLVVSPASTQDSEFAVSNLPVLPSPAHQGKMNLLRRSLVLEMDKQQRGVREGKGWLLPGPAEVQPAGDHVFLAESSIPENASFASPNTNPVPLRVRPQPTRSFDDADMTCLTCRSLETPRGQGRSRLLNSARPTNTMSNSSCRHCLNDSLTTVSGTTSLLEPSPSDSFILHAPDSETTHLSSRIALLGLLDGDTALSGSDDERPVDRPREQSAFRRVPLRPNQVIIPRNHSKPLKSPSEGATTVALPTSDEASGVSTPVGLPPRPIYPPATDCGFAPLPMFPAPSPRITESPCHDSRNEGIVSPPELPVGSHAVTHQDGFGATSPPTEPFHRRHSIPYLPMDSPPDTPLTKAVSLPPSPSSHFVRNLMSRTP